MRTKRTLAALGVALLATTTLPAFGQVVLAPPVIGKSVPAPEDAVTRAIIDELGASGIKPVELTMQLLRALEKCKNKMSCLASAGKAAGASHVIHTIMAERDGQVLAQLTVLEVRTKKPIDTLRSKTAAEYPAIERGVREASRGAVLALLASDDFPRPKSPVVSTPSASPSPTPVASTPPPPPPPSPTPTPVASAEPAPPPARLPPVARQVPSGYAGPMAAMTANANPPKGTNYVAIGITSAGAAAAVLGGVFLGLAKSDASARDETPQVFVQERTDLNDSAFGKQSIGIGMLAGGGGVLLLGVVFWATGVGASDLKEQPVDPNALVSIEPRADGFAIHW